MAVRVLAQLHKQGGGRCIVGSGEATSHSNRPAAEPNPEWDERRHAEIHALRRKGLTIAAIGQQLQLNRTTVRKFVKVNSAADIRRPAGQGPRGLDRFTAFMV